MHGSLPLREEPLLVDNLGRLVKCLLLAEDLFDANQHVKQLVGADLAVVVLVDETQDQIDLFGRDQLRHQCNRNQKIKNVASCLSLLAV